MQKFPFLTLAQMLVVLRVSIAFVFIAHASVRVIGGTVERFGGFLESKGFIMGVAIVWVITAFELVGGALLAWGRFTKWLSAAFIGMLIVGIILIHASFGWFVGEHGTGGVEYSAVLIVALLVLAASDTASQK
jgi:putative oxidoreductase